MRSHYFLWVSRAGPINGRPGAVWALARRWCQQKYLCYSTGCSNCGIAVGGFCIGLQKRRCPVKTEVQGEMAEWLKAHAWKACVRETVPWVRIPLSPPEQWSRAFHSIPTSYIKPSNNSILVLDWRSNLFHLVSSNLTPKCM